MNEMLQNGLEKVVAARKAIWLEQPAEIDSIWTKKGARNEGAVVALLATMRLQQFSNALFQMRASAISDRVDVPTLVVLARRMSDFYGDYLSGEYYQWTEYGSVIRAAREALSGVQTVDDFIAWTTEMFLYVTRLDHWIFDIAIPWARFGETFEEVARDRLKVTA